MPAKEMYISPLKLNSIALALIELNGRRRDGRIESEGNERERQRGSDRPCQPVSVRLGRAVSHSGSAPLHSTPLHPPSPSPSFSSFLLFLYSSGEMLTVLQQTAGLLDD